jgi:hypothetical protein
MIIDLLKSLYKVSISEDEIDDIQKEEPFVNFNYRQAEFLRRTIVLRKICHPILKHYKHAEKASKERFQFSFVNQYLNEAQECFVHGLFLASIMLCRSSLEIALREAIAYVESCKNKTTFLKEFIKLEKDARTLGKVLSKAKEIHLIEEGELNDIFTLHPKIKYNFKPRNLLDKFIHGSYSELFVLVQNVTIEGKGKSKDMEEFITKMYELNKVMNLGESFTRNIYVRMLLREELALFCLQAVFKVFGLVFFERLDKLL